MHFLGYFWSANQHRVQLHEIHLNFDNNCQVVSNFQDADYNTFLNVPQIPGLFFLYTKKSLVWTVIAIDWTNKRARSTWKLANIYPTSTPSFFPTPMENRLDLKRTARNLKENSCNVFIRGGELWPDVGLAERLFSKTMAKSRAVKTIIGLGTRFGSCLTEGISDNTKLSTTKTNGLLNNEQNPARRKLNFLYTQPGQWSEKNHVWGNVHGRETTDRKKTLYWGKWLAHTGYGLTATSTLPSTFSNSLISPPIFLVLSYILKEPTCLVQNKENITCN